MQGWGVGTGDRNLDKSCNGFVASGSQADFTSVAYRYVNVWPDVIVLN